MADTLARIKLRQGTAAQWASANPVLAQGEPGYETDTKRLRVGDGTSAFVDLPYTLTSASNPALLTFDPSGFIVVKSDEAFAGNLNSAPEGFVRLGSGVLNGPPSVGNNSFALTLSADVNNAVQMVLFHNASATMWRRDKISGTWGAWTGTVAASGNQSITGEKTFSDLIATVLRATTLRQPSVEMPTSVEGGFSAVNDPDGTFSSGVYAPTPVGGHFKSISNAGAFAIAAPSATGLYSLVIEVTNTGTAGAITLSGFAKVTGDPFTTTSGHRFQLTIIKTLNGVTANNTAMQ